MIECNPRPPLIRPNPEIGVVRRETLETLPMARLASGVVDSRQVALRAMMLTMTRRASNRLRDKGVRTILRLWCAGVFAP